MSLALIITAVASSVIFLTHATTFPQRKLLAPRNQALRPEDKDRSKRELAKMGWMLAAGHVPRKDKVVRWEDE